MQADPSTPPGSSLLRWFILTSTITVIRLSLPTVYRYECNRVYAESVEARQTRMRNVDVIKSTARICDRHAYADVAQYKPLAMTK